MKKLTAFFAALAAFSVAVAQDTLLMVNPYYLHTPIDIFDSTDCKEDSNLINRYNGYNSEQFILFQMYEPTTPTTIYGVAVAVVNESRMGLNCLNWDSVHPDVEIVANVYAKAEPGVYVKVNSVDCGISPYRGYIRYDTYNPYTNELVYCITEEIREFYFDDPSTVQDTCFVGISVNYVNGYTGFEKLVMMHEAGPSIIYTSLVDYLTADAGHQPYPFTPCDTFSLKPFSSWQTLDSCEYVIHHSSIWGGTFPIIAHHCKTPPRILWAVTGNGSCTLAWDSSGDGTYEVAVAPWGASPDTVSRRYVTTDTTFYIDSLDYGTTYSVWVRGRCSFPTTTMWSNWSSRMPVYVQTGVQEADGPRFEITPNPASGTVNVEHAFADGTISVLDMQGRTVLTAPASQHTLDISYLAVGSYVVRLETPSGIGTKLLQVQ